MRPGPKRGYRIVRESDGATADYFEIGSRPAPGAVEAHPQGLSFIMISRQDPNFKDILDYQIVEADLGGSSLPDVWEILAYRWVEDENYPGVGGLAQRIKYVKRLPGYTLADPIAEPQLGLRLVNPDGTSIEVPDYQNNPEPGKIATDDKGFYFLTLQQNTPNWEGVIMDLLYYSPDPNVLPDVWEVEAENWIPGREFPPYEGIAQRIKYINRISPEARESLERRLFPDEL